VLAAFDGSVAARDGLAAAAEIGGGESGMEVVLLARRLDEIETRQRDAGEVLAEAGTGSASFIHVRDGGPGDLLRIAEARRASLMVVPVGLLDAASARQVVERASCSLLLVR
jgi:hypothetical protein